MTKVDNQRPAQTTPKLTQAKQVAVKADPVAMMRAAEAAFDTSFGHQPALLTDDARAAPVAMSVDQQMTLWSALTPLVGGKPTGAAAEAFSLSIAAPAPPIADDELAAMLANAKGSDLPPALGHLVDALAAKKLAAVQEQSAKAQSLPLSVAVLTSVKTQVIGPLLKQQTVNVSGLQTAVSGLQDQTPFAGMDVTALAELVMMQCSNDSQLDLREVMKEMQKHLNVSKVLRGLKDRQEADAAQIKHTVDDEYNRLVGAHIIDPTKCSAAQYASWRGITLTQPSIDSEQDPPAVLYTPPELANPQTLHASDLPSAFLTVAAGGEAPAKSSGGTVETGANAGSLQLNTRELPITQTQRPDVQYKYTGPGSQPQQASAPVPSAPSGSTPSAPLPAPQQLADPGAEKGAGATSTCDALAAWQGRTQDLLSDQTDLTQQMQMRIQMAQNTYSQVTSMLSNMMKKADDTAQGIAKNFL